MTLTDSPLSPDQRCIKGSFHEGLPEIRELVGIASPRFEALLSPLAD
ncbi:hypothetical protein [Nostoc sp.]